MKREVSGDGGSLLSIMRALWPFIWPAERRDLKLRVAAAMVLLLAAKLATIAVPFTFKWATDALTGQGSAPVAPSSWLFWALTAPILMTIAYGGMRILMAVLTQIRDGIFAQVAMNAVRRLAYRTFEHMHQLSLRFHLERKTGGLTRVLERGRNAIEIIVRMVIMQLVPTIIELGLIVAVLLYQFDWRYVAVVVVTVTLYMVFTYFATEWRIGIRRRMNDSDTDANVKAIDSLLNYETVKYFVAEEREAKRYDRSMARYEDASVKAYVSLAVLNAGQATLFTVGLAAVMVMCAFGIKNGTNTIGDLVMINAMMIQLYQPLNFMGMVYREIKQAVIDIEMMFSILSRPPEIKDKPGARPLEVSRGAIRFENVSFAYDPEREILKRAQLRSPRRSHGRGGRPVRRRQVDHLAAAVPLLRGDRRAHLDRRPGHPRRHPEIAADGDRHGPAGHRPVQRHHPLQYPLRPLGGERCGGRGSGAARPDRRLHPHVAEGLRDRGRRARPEAVRRREAARRHRTHHPQGPADPAARRGDLGARQPHRAGHPGRAGAGFAEPHHPGHRAPPIHHRRRRRDHRARPGRDRRARHPPPAARARRPLCQHVEPAARGGGGAREARAGR